MQNFLQKVQDYCPGFDVASGCLLAFLGSDSVGKFPADLLPLLSLSLSPLSPSLDIA